MTHLEQSRTRQRGRARDQPATRPRGRVERLSLPMPEEGFVTCDQCRRESHAAVDLEDEARLPPRLLPPDREAALALYRWMLGHHVSISSWRLLADTLQDGLRNRSRTAQALDEAAFFLDVYSAMLAYAGSCTQEVYALFVRPRMMKVSPSFSGMWARDYERVQELVRRASPDPHCGFTVAYRKMAVLHMAQAKRLVPGGVSLLKAAGGHAAVSTTEHERELFDRFFLIDRKTRCRWSFRAQLLRRVSQILCDLKARPLSAVGYGEPALGPALSCEATLERLAKNILGGTQ